jgi:hypothetical protein
MTWELQINTLMVNVNLWHKLCHHERIQRVISTNC